MKLRVTILTFFLFLSLSTTSQFNCTCCCLNSNQGIVNIINFNCSLHQSTRNCTQWSPLGSFQICSKMDEVSGDGIGGTLEVEDEKTLCRFNSSDHHLTSKVKPGTRVCCPSEHKVKKHKEKIKDVYIGLLFIASVFLLLTLVVFLIIWDSHTVHGWTIFTEVLSNFFMILTVGLAHLQVRDHDTEPATYDCLLLAMCSHFFFLSTFCWMTAINFNLWQNLRGMKRPMQGRGKKIKLYLYYTLFAIGLPLLFVISGITLDFLHDHGKLNGDGTGIWKRPHYGKKFCYISKNAQGHFIYYPIGTLIATNFLLFLLTSWSLLKHRQSTRVLGGKGQVESGPTFNDRPTQSFLLFAKLFCVMGVSWVFEVFAWAFSKSGEDVPLYWIIFDVTNLIQGVAVFIVFVCKRDVLSLLKVKLKALTCPS